MSITSLENRSYQLASKVSLPKVKNAWIPDVNGFVCCEPLLVCGSNTGNSWEMDKVSAWIKLFSNTDTANFILKKDGVLAITQPDTFIFANDNGFSKYCTVEWTDVMNVDDIGCYTLEIEYTISGNTDTILWGEYRLWEFSNSIVYSTFRIKSIFNSNQMIEGINFTGSNVESHIRLLGYFGDRQPNTEIDNIIYQDRSMKKVTRENINKYILTTLSLKYEYIEMLIDLYLLSENELYLSDFNALNPSLNYLDFPVILSESPELGYNDGANKVSLKAVFNDKVKNNKSYY